MGTSKVVIPVYEWMDVKTVLRIAYSNQNIILPFTLKI
jgi:hypothetical protein